MGLLNLESLVSLVVDARLISVNTSTSQRNEIPSIVADLDDFFAKKDKKKSKVVKKYTTSELLSSSKQQQEDVAAIQAPQPKSRQKPRKRHLPPTTRSTKWRASRKRTSPFRKKSGASLSRRRSATTRASRSRSCRSKITRRMTETTRNRSSTKKERSSGGSPLGPGTNQASNPLPTVRLMLKRIPSAWIGENAHHRSSTTEIGWRNNRCNDIKAR